MKYERITIIGLGLIGSSIARAVHTAELAETVVGCDNNEITLTYARSHGFIDEAMRDPAIAVKHSDIVILATPPAWMGDVAKAIGPALKPSALVMDTASVKLPIMQAIAEHLPKHINFVPAHPIAGSEQSGIRASRTDLFHNKRVIVTPTEPLQENMLQVVDRFWRALGARVDAMPPELHDLVYAHVSHLPQLLAFAAARIITQPKHAQPAFTRLFHSSPQLWTEIFLLNQAPVLAALDRYLDVIIHINREFADAPETEPSAHDEVLAEGVLFPRIVASSLITTVMEAEKKSGFPFARYAGSGFADFTSPAIKPPETDIEQISAHYKTVSNLLASFIAILTQLRSAISEGNAAELQKLLSS